MANILKRIRKSSLSSSANKHEKLLEEDDQAQEDPVVEGVKFNVKYLGSCAVDTDCGEEETSAAIKRILDSAKERNKKLARVTVTVSERGVAVTSQAQPADINMDFQIHTISYCMADPTWDHVFSFITETEAGAGQLECHAFLCPKRKMAKAATLTIAQGFSLAYQSWQLATRHSSSRQQNTDTGDSSGPIVIQAEVEVVTARSQPIDNLIDLSKEEPRPPPRPLLEADLAPDTRQGAWQSSDTRQGAWQSFEDSGHEDSVMHRNFERLSLTAGPLQILNQIPRDGEMLKFGAFATSPASPGAEFGVSPLDTPRFGSSLSPSMLMSPVGSPYQYQE